MSISERGNLMENLIFKLFEKGIDFSFASEGKVFLEPVDTGYYGKVATEISYELNDGELAYKINYGHEGYPLLKWFKTIDDLLVFLLEVLRIK